MKKTDSLKRKMSAPRPVSPPTNRRASQDSRKSQESQMSFSSYLTMAPLAAGDGPAVESKKVPPTIQAEHETMEDSEVGEF